MEVFGNTDIGIKRKSNQDFYHISEDKNLFIVADGMGGHKAGEVASQMAVDTIVNYLNRWDLDSSNAEVRIKEALDLANKTVYQRSLEKKECLGMGTTVVLLYICEDRALIANAGDSRLYIIRNDDIEQVTEDHSLVAELYKSGTITKEEAHKHPQKNIITRAVGTSENIEIDFFKLDIERGDIFLISTDGLTNVVSDQRIKKELLKSDSLEKACNKLIDLAKNEGSQDNITVLIVKK